MLKPVIYLITGGETTATTTPASKDFSQVLSLVEAAVAAEVSLLQLREKNLNSRVLCELAFRAAQLARNSRTRLLVNDRADIAFIAGAPGVHLTAGSLEPGVVRKTFGDDFLVGVSCHTVAEVSRARDQRADFAVFGPVFATDSKRIYGEPIGLERLRQVVSMAAPFPLLALGGITLQNVATCLRAGAAGIAAIRLLQDPAKLKTNVSQIREIFTELEEDDRSV